MDPIIQVKNLDFVYNKGKDNQYHALINVSLDIYPEEYIMIFGPSGCGKSTLLNIIAGLETPDSGNIFVFGKDLTKMNEKEFAAYHRRETGFVFQAYNLISSLTVLDNVALPQIFISASKGKREAWAKQLLERFGILKQAKKIPTELSGGQQQRIGIARAIVNNPRIVLADEPVGNLDSNSAKNVLEIFGELNEKEKKTIVMVTHNPENLIHADRIIYMKDGVITHEVINHDKNKKKPKEKKIGDENIVKIKPPSAELRDLMRAYQGLSPEQINILIMPYKAKIFSHHFITTRNMEETSIFEEVMQRRLLGAITQEEFFEVLHRNSQEGGVGFDRRTAEKIARRVNRLIRAAYFAYRRYHQAKNKEGRHDEISAEEKAKKTSEYILNSCYREHRAHLSAAQLSLIKNAVRQRLSGNMQKDEFFKKLDSPEREGGAGLNSKTVKALTEEIELILILGFGIVQTKDMEITEKKEQSSAPELNTGVTLQDAINSEQEREEKMKK